MIKKISFDFDGTLTSDPRRFKFLIDLLKSDPGVEIFVLTGRPKSEESNIKKLLSEWKISYDKLISYPEPYPFTKVKWDSYMDIKIGDFKADVINKEGITVHFDDNCIHKNVIKKKTDILLLSPEIYKHSSIREIKNKVLNQSLKEINMDTKTKQIIKNYSNFSSLEKKKVVGYLEELSRLYRDFEDYCEMKKTEVGATLEKVKVDCRNTMFKMSEIRNKLKKYGVEVFDLTESLTLLSTLSKNNG